MVVVLAVVAILAAILTPTIAKNINDAKITRANNETQVIASAMGSFFKDVGRWPTQEGASASTADYYYLLYGDGNVMEGASQWSSAVNTRDDTFANHLARNTPGGTSTAANQYTVTGELRWRGPYITEVKADPWGTQYSCNIRSFWDGTTYKGYAVYVLSAGEDRTADTGDTQTITATTAPALGNDDIGFRMQ
jgi:type II secretory pathway pseudopilin PulG